MLEVVTELKRLKFQKSRERVIRKMNNKEQRVILQVKTFKNLLSGQNPCQRLRCASITVR